MWYRARTYNSESTQARMWEKSGRVLILAPRKLYGLDTLKRTKEGMAMLYRQGYSDAQAIEDFLS